MYKCQDCDELFSDPGIKVVSEEYEIWGANVTHDHHYACCPRCGSEDFDVAEDPGDDLG